MRLLTDTSPGWLSGASVQHPTRFPVAVGGSCCRRALVQVGKPRLSGVYRRAQGTCACLTPGLCCDHWASYVIAICGTEEGGACYVTQEVSTMIISRVLTWEW